MKLGRAIAPVLVAGLVASTGYGIEAARADDHAHGPLGPGDVTIRLGIEHSRFDLDEIRVVAGTRVRFVVDNTDPIAHELILGGPEVHARHESGTHPSHPPVPGEVSVAANARAVTTFRFDEPGRVDFACHLPGHYDFGMHGTVVVLPAEGT